MSENYGSEEFKEGTFSVSLCCFHSFSVPHSSISRTVVLAQTAITFIYTRMFFLVFPRRGRWRWGRGRDRCGDSGQEKVISAVPHLPSGPQTLSRQHPPTQLRCPATPWETGEGGEQQRGTEAERRAPVLEPEIGGRGQRQAQDSQRAGEAAEKRAEDELHGSEGRGPSGGQQWKSGEGGDPEEGGGVHHGGQRAGEEAVGKERWTEEEEQRAEAEAAAAQDFTLTSAQSF